MSAARWLALAASPSFASMAVVSAMGGGDPAAILCSAASGAGPFGGMAVMYALMSLFHAPAWLRLLEEQRADRGGTPQRGVGLTPSSP